MNEHPSTSLINLTFLIYCLHLFSAVVGLLSSAFIVTAFLTGWPSLIAVCSAQVFQDTFLKDFSYSTGDISLLAV